MRTATLCPYLVVQHVREVVEEHGEAEGQLRVSRVQLLGMDELLGLALVEGLQTQRNNRIVSR